MNLHIYTDIDTLFGRACRLWMEVLLEAGHEVEYIDLGLGTTAPLPDVGAADVNLLVCGIYAFERFGRHGLPPGKNILWMLDPLTRNPDAAVHGHKAALFDAFAPRLDALLAMDQPIEDYVRRHHPSLPVSQLPYLIADKNMHAPLAEADRTEGVIFIGHPSPPRLEAEMLFHDSDVQAEFVWAGLWGKLREERLRQARIALSIHADPEHIYFDQFRTLEAWAAGTVLVSETTTGLAPHGITPGTHLAMADRQDLPALCDALLHDAARRQAVITAAQDLLRQQFSLQRWRGHMLDTLHHIV